MSRVDKELKVYDEAVKITEGIEKLKKEAAKLQENTYQLASLISHSDLHLLLHHVNCANEILKKSERRINPPGDRRA